MRVSRLVNHRKPAFGKNMLTPMIDVVFLLLVFFICASSGQMREAVLPTVLSQGSTTPLNTTKPQQREQTEVWIDIAGSQTGETSLRLNNQPLKNLEELRQSLTSIAASSSDPIVILRPTEEMTTQMIVAVMDACEQAGMVTIHFSGR